MEFPYVLSTLQYWTVPNDFLRKQIDKQEKNKNYNSTEAGHSRYIPNDGG